MANNAGTNLPCNRLGPRLPNARTCTNQPTIIENFGTGCGGVGALSAAAKRAQQTRAGGFSRSSDSSRCPECLEGDSNIAADGKANCNPNALTRRQQLDSFGRMFPLSGYPRNAIKRRFNYPLRKRI